MTTIVQKSEILIIDDEIENLNLLIKLLSEHNLRIRPVRSGLEGIKSAQFRRPQLILLDIKLPDIDGFEVCRRLRALEETKDIPVIFLSAHTSDEFRITCFRCGGQDFICKPFYDEEILARIQTQLGYHQAIKIANDAERDVRNSLEVLKTEYNNRLKIEETLIRSEFALKKSQEIAHIGHWILNLDTKGVIASDEVYRIFEMPSTDTAMDPFEILESSRFDFDRALIKNYVDLLIQQQKHMSIEFTIQSRLGVQKHLYVENLDAEPDHNGCFVKVFGIVQDITERKNYQIERERLLTQAIQASKLETLGMIASGIAHDFNNLLSGIYGYVDTANDKESIDDIRLELDRVLKTIDKARKLTLQLQSFSKCTNPKVSMENIAVIINESVVFALSGSNVVASFSSDEKYLPALIDRRQIDLVIAILVLNSLNSAVTEITEKVKVAVSVTKSVLGSSNELMLTPGVYACIIIGLKNKVLCISSENQDVGFEYKLQLCQSIVKNHNGYLASVDNKCYQLYLPLIGSPRSNNSIADSKFSDGKKFVFVINDEPSMCDTLIMMLESLGFAGKSFTSGIEIVHQLESGSSEQVVCIFADLESNRCTDGYELLRMLEHANLTVPVVAMFDEPDEKSRDDLIEYGFAGCIIKPLTTASMAKTLKACTVQHSL